MSNVFGLIVSGRLVQTNFAPLSETQFLITITEADNINHAVVFLTGVAPLPAGTVGMVYWSWPDPAAPPNWQLLGHISNTKPSAIFKIGTLKKLHELSSENKFISAFGQQQICHNAQIGIAIEPESNVQLLASSVVSTSATYVFG
ncbi:protein OPI10 homolog [Spodoptera litura]|uniref:Protein OPI10 homolog n=1 Tax=Spodoptera litura TaxID=69820 RepID=A0A9J7EW21_SPOLT|nr:protein OPI10 homolog [Spodoptera litura]